MNSSSKDRIKLLIITVTFLSALLVFGYMTFINPVVATYMPGIKIVNHDDIDIYEKRKTNYAYKVNENDEFLVKYNYYKDGEFVVNTLSLTNEQYDELVEGEYYWFKVKFRGSKDSDIGIIKKIYTDNPRGK